MQDGGYAGIMMYVSLKKKSSFDSYFDGEWKLTVPKHSVPLIDIPWLLLLPLVHVTMAAKRTSAYDWNVLWNKVIMVSNCSPFVDFFLAR